MCLLMLGVHGVALRRRRSDSGPLRTRHCRSVVGPALRAYRPHGSTRFPSGPQSRPSRHLWSYRSVLLRRAVPGGARTLRTFQSRTSPRPRSVPWVSSLRGSHPSPVLGVGPLRDWTRPLAKRLKVFPVFPCLCYKLLYNRVLKGLNGCLSLRV